MAKKIVEYLTDKDLSLDIDGILHSSAKFIAVLEHVKITAVFLYRTEEKGSDAVAGTNPNVALKKVAPEVRIITKPETHFVLVVDKHFWDNADEKARRGNVFNVVSRLEVTLDDAGNPKTRMRPYDLTVNVSTVEACGEFCPEVTMVKNALLGKMYDAANATISAAGIKTGTAPEPEAAPAPRKARTIAPEPEAAPAPEPMTEPVPTARRGRVIAPEPPEEPADKPRVRAYVVDANTKGSAVARPTRGRIHREEENA